MMQIIDVEQGSEAWLRARAGLPTASMFSTVMASGRGGESLTRKTYLYKLAGERITGEPMQSYSNANMERGKQMEGEARELYGFLRDGELRQVGFIRNDMAGCSPDSFVGEDGLLEVKTALPHLMVEYILKDEFPPSHKAQTQGQLWVTGREWVDIIVYWPGISPLIKRASRDEVYIARLSTAVKEFNADLEDIVHRVSTYGQGDALQASNGVM